MTGKGSDIILWLYAQDKEKLWDIKEHKEKRTLTQNAYYWQLCTKLADKLRYSKSRIHNMMLRSYGQIELIDDKACYIVIPDTESAENAALEAETYHIRPTSQVKPGKDGIMYRTYMLLRGSSTYNTQEMGILLDGLIQEAKQQDIETLPPRELERMRLHELQIEKKQNDRHSPQGQRKGL